MNKVEGEQMNGQTTRAGRNGEPRGPVLARAGKHPVRKVFTVLLVLILSAAFLAAGARWHESVGHAFGFAGHDHGEASAANPSGRKELWTCGMHPQVIQDHPGTCPICHMKLTPLMAEGASAMSGERKVKYWWDPMLGADSISQKPGKSAMGMDLVPVYEAEVTGGTAVTIDPVIVQNMGVRVATVTKGPVKRDVRAVGYLVEAEPNIHDVNLRVSGWVQKLFAATEGQHVMKGEPLFELYSPELQVAAEEMIGARKSAAAMGERSDGLARRSGETLVSVGKRKLSQWGIDEEQIVELSKLDHAPPTITFRSPVTGHVTQKNVVDGAAVKAGDRVLQIVDHSTLWLDAQVFEQDLPFVKLGEAVTATVESVPGKTFTGKVVFVHPHVDPMTRAATVRTELPNPDISLRPGMYATVSLLSTPREEAILVPRESIIDSGTRKIVFVSTGSGHFEPRKVRTGFTSSDGAVEVLEGLAPGETVVTSGQFLLDAESRMKEAIQKHLDKSLLSNGNAARAIDVAVAPTPSTKPWAVVPAPPSLQADRVFEEYLSLSKALGAASPPKEPLDVSKLVDAASKVSAPGLSRKIQDAAAAMAGKPVPEQRKLFRALSDGVIQLTEKDVPSKALGEKLFVAHCPMAFGAGGQWIQAGSVVQNPFYETDMKQCGEITRTIETEKGGG